ncbi:MAG: glycerophosphodiester phosphodiesterase [Deltaproteobacteria bacterium]|nr:glycerophosphodiester phosphodiesterase [Deltaproteobacteria bacterium]
MKIFAHRGASGEAAENSLEAIQKAIEIGVDGIEFDCLLTKDKVPVVTHYDDLRVLFKIEGFVHDKNWHELEPLGIPTLTAVLEQIKPSSVLAIFDIKSQPNLMESSPYIVAGLAQEILPSHRILLTSFYWRHLRTLKKFFPRLERSLIISKSAFKLVPLAIFDKFLGVRAIHPLMTWLTPELVQKWHKRGFKVHAWVANTAEELKRCEALKVDGVFTDNARFAREEYGR